MTPFSSKLHVAIAATVLSLGVGCCCAVSAGAALVVVAGVALMGAGGLLRAQRGAVSSHDRQRSMIVSPPWWLAPAPLAAGSGIVAIGLTLAVSGADFRANWHTPKYFNGSYAFSALLALGVFVASAAIASVWRQEERSGSLQGEHEKLDHARLRRAAVVFTSLTFAGYVSWGLLAVVRGLTPGDVIAAATGNSGVVFHLKHGALRTLPGVTTLTQCATPAVVLCALYDRLSGRKVRFAIPLLVCLAVLRSLLHAERLAILEVILPLLVVRLTFSRPKRQQSGMTRLMRFTAPLLIPLAVLIIFGAFEYGRSWTYYRQQDVGTSFTQFTVRRLAGYYATANNNSVVLLQNDKRQVTIPYFSLQWLWTFPVIGHRLDYAALAGSDPTTDWGPLLAADANPEFNNPGALLLLGYDYGKYLSLLVWAVLGAVSGALYGRVRRGEVRLLALYAAVSIGLLEIGREFYWGSGRAFPALVGGLIVAIYLRPATASRQYRRGLVRGAPQGTG